MSSGEVINDLIGGVPDDLYRRTNSRSRSAHVLLLDPIRQIGTWLKQLEQTCI